jgi:hypothetical protein
VKLSAEWRERTEWVPRDRPLGKALRSARWIALAGYFALLLFVSVRDGVPLGRTSELVWLAVGLACCCIGRHPVWLLLVAIDFLPFVLVLVAYDYLRDIVEAAGMPTWWTPQIEIEKFLFAGHVPTVWFQEHLKHASPDEWYDVIVALTYCSYFLIPYVTAGVLWLRSRSGFRRWSLRFVSVSFFAYGLFVLIPTAPPWAAAKCTAAEVASHPSQPRCMSLFRGDHGRFVPGNLLGEYHPHLAGAPGFVQRIPTDGLQVLHLSIGHNVWARGAHTVDQVAAVPSLHIGGTVLFCVFMWSRLNKWWRPLLVGYPLLMMFSLAYAGEHYITDGIAGALCAFLVHWGAGRVERWHEARSAPDTLKPQPDPTLESDCPPTAMTPSST